MTDYNDINKGLIKKYNRIVDDIVNTYPVYKVFPKVEKYEDNYNKNLNNLKNLQGKIFLFKNKLSQGNETHQKDITHIDDTIYKLEEENKILQTELTSLNNSNNAAHGMLTDSNFLYNRQLTSNWLFFLSLSSVGYLYYNSS